MQFPTLTAIQVTFLEADFIEDDVHEAIASLSAGKASGFLLEVYTRYVDIVAPILVQVYSLFFRKGNCRCKLYYSSTHT